MAVPFNTIPPAYPNVPFNFIPTAPARSPVATRITQSARRPRSQTVSQVANQRVNAVLNPQIAAQNAFNARQDQVIQQFANALLGKLTPVAGQIGGYYDSAINQTGALSNQAAQFLQNANPSGSVADLLRSAGAPQSQIDQQTAQLGQTFGSGAGVLSFLGGTVPGGQLAADKAAAQTEAAQYPLFAGLKAQQDLSSALWQQGQDMQKIQAQRPQLYQQAQQTILENNRARRDEAATARQNAITNAGNAANRRERIREYNQGRADSIAAAKQARADRNAIAHAKTVADAAAAKKQSTRDFLKLIYSPGFEAQNYSNDDLVALAKNVFGLDLGKGFTAPTAPPAKPTAPHWITVKDSTGQYAENVNDPNPSSTRVRLGGPVPKGAPAAHWVTSVDTKTGKQYATDTNSGKRILLPGTKTATTSTTAPTTKTINGITFQWGKKPNGKMDWIKSDLPAETPKANKARNVRDPLRAGIASAFYGVPEQRDVNNKVTQKALPPVNYQEAITHAVKAGYSRAAATKMANRFYMPGIRGRPMPGASGLGVTGSVG